jgi:hypothetical protein
VLDQIKIPAGGSATETTGGDAISQSSPVSTNSPVLSILSEFNDWTGGVPSSSCSVGKA